MVRPQYELEFRKECTRFPEYDGGYPISGVLEINLDTLGWIWDVGSHVYVRLAAQSFLDSDKIRDKTWGLELEEQLRAVIDYALDECIRDGRIRKGKPDRVHVIIKDPHLGIK
jgi:hypothetical protein